MQPFHLKPSQHQRTFLVSQNQSHHNQPYPNYHQSILSIFLSPFNKLRQAFITFVFLTIDFFTTLPARILRKTLYYLQKFIRYILWINIKGLVSWINFVYRFFAFFRVKKVVSLLQMIAKTYFPEYSAIDFDRGEENISRLSLIVKKKDFELINVDKFEKKVKNPSWFGKNKEKKKQRNKRAQESKKKQKETESSRMEGKRQSQEAQSVSPRLVKLSQSHEKIRKGQIGGISGVRVEIPDRGQSQQERRIFPDRDISPQRYMKPIPRIGESSFNERQYELEGQGIEGGNEQDFGELDEAQALQREEEFRRENKQQLERQLVHLREKMQQLIEDNSSYIKELEEWLKQKSETIMMTRTQNIQLLDQMQSLQKQNIKKTSKLQQLQNKVEQMEKILSNQKTQTTELCFQIVRLNQEIQSKSLQIVILKQKINQNIIKLQQSQKIQNLSQSSNLQKQPQQSQQNQRILEKLRQEEKKTEQLAQKVEKVLQQERKRLQKTLIQPLSQRNQNKIEGMTESEKISEKKKV